MGKILDSFGRDAEAILDDSPREEVVVDADFAKAEVVNVEMRDDFVMEVGKAGEV